MNAISALLQADWAERAGWTLLHSLWQIAAIAAVYAMAVFLLRGRSANSRYLLGCAAILTMLGLPVGTHVWLSQDALPDIEKPGNKPDVAMLPTESPDSPGAPIQPASEPAKAVAAPAGVTAERPATADFMSVVRRFLPWVTAGWMVGVLVLSLRPLCGWWHVRRLRRDGHSRLPDALLQASRRVKDRLRVNRAVQFVQSALVEVPTAIGGLRPMVLLPASAITGLSVAQIELILAHELAHLKRHDWLVNLAQTMIESLLFYHPAMWWVSHQIRKERENCCDDIAVSWGGSRTSYAQALARLEEQRLVRPAAVLAATGGRLLSRVRRLLGQPADRCGYRYATAWVAGLVTIGCVIMALAINPTARARDAEEDVLQRILADWKRKRAAVQTFRYEFKGTSTVPKGAWNEDFDSPEVFDRPWKPGESIPAKTHVGPHQIGLLVDFRNKRVRVESQSDLFNGDDRTWRPSESVSAYDGTVCNRFRPPAGFSGEEWPSTVVFWEDCGSCLLSPLHRPLLFAHGRIPPFMIRGKPEEYFLLRSEAADFAVTGKRQYKGRECTVLRGSETRDGGTVFEEFWVDVERESAIVRNRMQVYGIVVRDMEIDYHQTEHGWLPKNFTCNNFIGRVGEERAGLPKELRRFKVTKASVNPKLKLADFQLKPSPGMMVRNESTGKTYRVPAEEAKSAATGTKPKHKNAHGLFRKWQDNARMNGNIPGGSLGSLATAAARFVKLNPTSERAPKLAELLKRIDMSRDWTQAEAVALLDEVTSIYANLPKWAVDGGWDTTAPDIRTGHPLPAALEDAPWGEAQPNGLRAAWLLDPRAKQHRLGTPLRSRILFHNAGRNAVVFRALNWNQPHRHKARDAKNADIKISAIEWTTRAQVVVCRLVPGEFTEVVGAGIGVGADRDDEDWRGIQDGAWIEAKEGDVVTFTPAPVSANGREGVVDPRLRADPNWWLRFITDRLSRDAPLPDDANERKRLLNRAMRDLFGTAPTPEETAALVADRAPDAMDRLANRLARRAGISSFTGTLQAGETTFRVLAADPNAANRPRVATGPGRYTLGDQIRLVIERKFDGDRRVDEASIVFYSRDPRAEPPGKPHEIDLPDGLSTWAIAWERDSTMLWVAEKGILRSYDFATPAQVKEGRIAPARLVNVPEPLREALRPALEGGSNASNRIEIDADGRAAGLQAKLIPCAFRDGRQRLCMSVSNDSVDKVTQLRAGGFPPEILVDGVRYRSTWTDTKYPIEKKPRVVRPGTSHDGDEFTLDRNWVRADGTEKLQLKPGRHTIQAVLYATQQDAPDDVPPTRILSNSIEIGADGGVVGRRDVKIRVLGGAEKKPLEGLELEVKRRHWEEGVTATTQEDGTATFSLLPGDFHYDIRFESPVKLPYLPIPTNNKRRVFFEWRRGHVPYHSQFQVGETAEERQVEFHLADPCELVLRAVDVDTGQGVPGVRFAMENFGGEDWAQGIRHETLGPKERPNESAGYLNETDQQGYFRRFVGPRRWDGWKYMISAVPPGYKEVDPRKEVEIRTPLGRKKAEHTFLLRRTGAEAAKQATPEDEAALRRQADEALNAAGHESGYRDDEPVVSRLWLRTQHMSDQTPEQVRRLGEIHLLIINGPTITEAHTAVLKDVKNAKRLLLCSRQINASAVKHVRECAGLKWLKFYNQSVTDKWLQELGPVTQLEYLFVRGDEITDAGVAFLRGMTELRELHLFSDSLTDAGLVHLGSLKNLRVLRLHGSLLTGTGLVHLQDMSEMTELHVSGSLTDAGLAHLATLKNLQVLRLHSGAITGSGIAELKPLTNLERLSLGSRITNDNLIQLKLLSNLKALHLSSQKITDAGLVHLTALRNLEGLHLDETNVTAEGEATLRRSLPKCEIKRSGSSAQDVRVKLTPGVFRDGRQWLSVRVVNDSTDKVATLEPGGFPLRILVNGVAYRPKWSDSTRTRETEPRIIRPGTGNNGGEFTLDRNWVADDTGQKLELKPGRNAIRAIVHVTVKDAPEGDNELHYLSNTVAVDADGRAEDMQSVRLRVLGGAAKKPLAGLELTLTPSGWETGVTAMTDEDGSATFTLLPNTYKIALRSSKELPYLRFAAEQPHRGIYHRHITVAETPGDQQFDVNLYDPCELVLRAVDVETGKGVPGVAFVTENVAAEMWAEPIFNDTLGPGPRWSDLPIDHKSFLSDEDGYVRRLIGPREGWGYWIWTTPPEYEMVVADRQGDRVVVHSKMRGDRRRHFYTFTLNGEEVDPRVEIPTPLGRKKAEHTFLLRRKKATEPDDAAE